jgi:hypothetical protein
MTVTVTFDSSTAARSVSLVTLRELTATPLDTNPSVATDNTSPYTTPSTGTLAQSDSAVLGYYALQGPTSFSYPSFSNDAIAVTSPAQEARGGPTAPLRGFIGTTGSTADTNVTVGVSWDYVSATTATTQAITNATANRNGITGVVSLKNTGVSPDLAQSDFIQHNREYYVEQASFDGTSGTGAGPRSSRPGTCTTGVAWWATDQGGDWNTTSGGANDGTLDKCTATNTWTNGWYVPKAFPHPLRSGS